MVPVGANEVTSAFQIPFLTTTALYRRVHGCDVLTGEVELAVGHRKGALFGRKLDGGVVGGVADQFRPTLRDLGRLMGPKMLTGSTILPLTHGGCGGDARCGPPVS